MSNKKLNLEIEYFKLEKDIVRKEKYISNEIDLDLDKNQFELFKEIKQDMIEKLENKIICPIGINPKILYSDIVKLKELNDEKNYAICKLNIYHEIISNYEYEISKNIKILQNLIYYSNILFNLTSSSYYENLFSYRMNREFIINKKPIINIKINFSKLSYFNEKELSIKLKKINSKIDFIKEKENTSFIIKINIDELNTLNNLIKDKDNSNDYNIYELVKDTIETYFKFVKEKKNEFRNPFVEYHFNLFDSNFSITKLSYLLLITSYFKDFSYKRIYKISFLDELNQQIKGNEMNKIKYLELLNEINSTKKDAIIITELFNSSNSNLIKRFEIYQKNKSQMINFMKFISKVFLEDEI